MLGACNGLIVPWPAPMGSPVDLGPIADEHGVVGAGGVPLNAIGNLGSGGLAPELGDPFFGTFRISGGFGFRGWDVHVIAGPSFEGSAYDLAIGRELWQHDRLRLDVTAGGGLTWFADASSPSAYTYFAIAPHAGPRLDVKVSDRVEVPIQLLGEWSQVLPVSGTSYAPALWWIDTSSAVNVHFGVVVVGTGLDLLTVIDAQPMVDLRWTVGVGVDLGPRPLDSKRDLPSDPSGDSNIPEMPVERVECDDHRFPALNEQEDAATPGLLDADLLLAVISGLERESTACAADYPGFGATGMVELAYLERLFVARYPDSAEAPAIAADLAHHPE